MGDTNGPEDRSRLILFAVNAVAAAEKRSTQEYDTLPV